jgi:hypothetical protein
VFLHVKYYHLLNQIKVFLNQIHFFSHFLVIIKYFIYLNLYSLNKLYPFLLNSSHYLTHPLNLYYTHFIKYSKNIKNLFLSTFLLLNLLPRLLKNHPLNHPFFHLSSSFILSTYNSIFFTHLLTYNPYLIYSKRVSLYTKSFLFLKYELFLPTFLQESLSLNPIICLLL